MTTEIRPTRLDEYIRELLPWTHGHQAKSIATFVAAIFEKQTGNQAEIARTQCNQEAAVKRLSRLIHNERLNPDFFPDWLCRKALAQLPRASFVRFASGGERIRLSIQLRRRFQRPEMGSRIFRIESQTHRRLATVIRLVRHQLNGPDFIGHATAGSRGPQAGSKATASCDITPP